MTPIRTRATALGASTLIAVVALTGCANDPTPTEAPTAAPTVEAVAPEPEVEPTPTVEPQPEPTPDPVPTYELPDGSEVELDPAAETLPKKVRKDLGRKAGEAAGGGPSDWINTIRDAEKATGRRAIVVMRILIEPEGKPHGHYWAVSAHPTAIHPPVASKAEAVALAEAHVAAQPDPAAWVVVVSDQ